MNLLKLPIVGDPNVIQMVNDMQIALDRIPPEVASILNVDRATMSKTTNNYKQGNGRILNDPSEPPVSFSLLSIKSDRY